ncbi:hypothetical protein WJX74_002791 [Apatococcus lobatus]|uniref:Uncharacterized protein n=2 Tax=Apatococcus TaxID=904362 RepID=A0AAW1T6U5_9CHLO
MVAGSTGWVLAICLCLSFAAAKPRHSASEASPSDARLAELEHLASQTKDHVIQLNTAAFDRFAGGKRRPYALVIFLTARHLVDKPQLQLGKLRREFGLLSSQAAKSGNERDAAGLRHFFIVLDFHDSEPVFHRLGVNTLPYIFRLPSSKAIEAGAIKLRPDDQMRMEDYSSFPWSANDMAGFLQEKTGISVGTIDRPSLFNSRLFPVLALAFVAAGTYVAYRIYYLPILKNLGLWLAASLVVFWFSASGGMHNIIRGVPLVMPDMKTGKVQMFLQQAQGQLGAEGFIMGTLYTACGLSVAVLTWLAPNLKDRGIQRGVSYLALLTGLVSFYQVISNYRWKTNYRMGWFF